MSDPVPMSIQHAEHATDTVERIQALLSQPISIAQTNLSIWASVGIAMYPSDGRDMEACRQLSDWRAKGLDVPAVAVNLSPTSFHNLDLPRMIADIRGQTSVPNQHLPEQLPEVHQRRPLWLA